LLKRRLDQAELKAEEMYEERIIVSMSFYIKQAKL